MHTTLHLNSIVNGIIKNTAAKDLHTAIDPSGFTLSTAVFLLSFYSDLLVMRESLKSLPRSVGYGTFNGLFNGVAIIDLVEALIGKVSDSLRRDRKQWVTLCTMEDILRYLLNIELPDIALNAEQNDVLYNYIKDKIFVSEVISVYNSHCIQGYHSLFSFVLGFSFINAPFYDFDTTGEPEIDLYTYLKTLVENNKTCISEVTHAKVLYNLSVIESLPYKNLIIPKHALFNSPYPIVKSFLPYYIKQYDKVFSAFKDNFSLFINVLNDE